MTTWQNFKQSITSISENKLTIIDTLSYLQAERMTATPSLTTLNRYAHGLGLEIRMQVTPETRFA